MPPRKVYQRVLMTGTVLLAAAAALTAQNSAPPPPAPAAWAASGQETPPAPTSGPVIIATTKTGGEPAVLPPEARLPLPDDGLPLRPIGSTASTPAPRPTPGLMPPVPSTTMPTGPIQPALYLPGQEASAAIRPTVSASPLPPEGPASPAPRPSTTPNADMMLPRSGSALSIEVQGPESLVPGQAAPCILIVRNLGQLTLGDVKVELPLPSGSRVLTSRPGGTREGNRQVWNLGNLDGNSERRIELEVIHYQVGEVFLGPVARFTAAMAYRSNIARPPFAVSVTGPESAVVGEKVTFQVQVGNHTTAPMRKIHLRCELSAGLQHVQGQVIEADLGEDLAAGQVRAIQLEAQVIQPGRQQVFLTAESETGGAARGNTTLMVGEPSLGLTLQGPRQARVGQAVPIRVMVTNPGRNEVGPVRITQTLPQGVEFLRASAGGVYNAQINSVTWVMKQLAGGQQQQLSYEVRGRQPGDWALAGSLEVDGMAPMRATHALQLEAIPNLALELTALDDPLPVGRETVYEARVFNGGPAPARDVRVVIQVPASLVPTHAEGPTPWQIRGQQVVFEPLSEMRQGVDAIYRVRVRADRPGQGRFRAEANAPGLSRPLVQELSSRVPPTGTPAAR
ncbi:MAG: hypothetical protein U0840_02945 [Gemmataceae bacterium]